MMPTATKKGTMTPPKSGVTVRMYNTGFGDCLLLAFPAEKDSACYVLIDCGVHHQYPGHEAKMKSVAKDIVKATGGHVAVVAITHEHTDHTYGFKYAQEEFKDIEIDNLWLAWTEDPANATAIELSEAHAVRVRGLTAAITALDAAGSPLAAQLQAVMDFDLPDAQLAASTTTEPLAFLRERSANKLDTSAEYRNPKDTITLPGVKNVRIHVLGPPEDKKALGKLEVEGEMYAKMAAMSTERSFAIAALALAGNCLTKDEEGVLERSHPFDGSYRITRDDASKPGYCDGFFERYYGFSEAEEEKWRRIDLDWLAVAVELDAKNDDILNNTSLVLAVELTKTDPHKVLLFVGDAQVGNWLSWPLDWPVEGSDKRMTLADLLQRTVLYKVGHHGSRNATLRAKGLEKMESDGLVAMIPVDEHWAKDRKRPWEHPATNLLERLKEKTHGRVIRTDEIPSAAEELTKPDGMDDSEWKRFTKQVKWDKSGEKLWIQYTVPG